MKTQPRPVFWTRAPNTRELTPLNHAGATISGKLDIAIAGAGIAGLSAAAFLGRAGHRVIVIDKASAPAHVGSGLIIQPTGQAALAALGLSDALMKRGARLDRLDGRTEGGKRKVLDVCYSTLGTDMFGVSVHRAALFEMLHKCAREAGAGFYYGREVAGADDNGAQMRLLYADGEFSAPFDLIIDALGVRSPFIERRNCFLDYGALWANTAFPSAHEFDENVLNQRYRGAGISAGVMPIGSLQDGGEPLAAFFWTLRADEFESWRAAPLERWKEKVMALWPEAAPVLASLTSHDQFVFAHYAHHTAPAPVEGRIVHIGDAWHCASPQLGQGANMALLDAWALSLAMARKPQLDAALIDFVRMRRAHVRLYQAISWLFTPVYQSDLKLIPFLRDVLAEPLSSLWPMPRLLASVVAGTLGGPLGRLK